MASKLLFKLADAIGTSDAYAQLLRATNLWISSHRIYAQDLPLYQHYDIVQLLHI